ncbi:MAG TPA: ester cyclase [Gemmatimonadaceae bacterium]|jgi:predicted ester cyclase
MAFDKKKLSLRLFDEVWNKGKFELLEEFNTPFTLIRDPYVPIKTKGVIAAKEYVQFFKKAIPDLFLTVEDQIAEGDKLVTFLKATGTHKGEFLGLAPTFKNFTISCVVMLRFEGEKIVESYSLWDALGFMRAVGVELPGVAAFV